MQQAWKEHLTLTLVLNKVDRLFLQLGLTPIKAYDCLLRVLEQVNSVLAQMFTADVLQQNAGQTSVKTKVSVIESDNIYFHFFSRLVHFYRPKNK